MMKRVSFSTTTIIIEKQRRREKTTGKKGKKSTKFNRQTLEMKFSEGNIFVCVHTHTHISLDSGESFLFKYKIQHPLS